MKEASVSVAIVSHNQTEMAQRLVLGLEHHAQRWIHEILVIENRRRSVERPIAAATFPIRSIFNAKPKGLAANVNQAFRLASGEVFCTLNPDILLSGDVFADLLEDIQQGRGQIVAPLITDTDGRVQDSARRLPTPWELTIRRLVPRRSRVRDEDDIPALPGWLAGMFLCMPSRVFADLGGMDERYFLYFEDVDFCSRARLRGYRLFVDKGVRVVHQARRASRRNPRHMGQHLASAVRFFSSPVYREARRLPSLSQE